MYILRKLIVAVLCMTFFAELIYVSTHLRDYFFKNDDLIQVEVEEIIYSDKFSTVPEQQYSKIEPIRTKLYTVKAGDSLWDIADMHNIHIDTLVGCNTFPSFELRAGMLLRIPNHDGIFYIMKRGEKIASVCRYYGVSLRKTKQVNAELDIFSLKDGEEVFLPGARYMILPE